MQIKSEHVKNILCVRNDRFGEFLLNIPALRALKETFINARLIMVIDPYIKDLTRGIPLIDESIEWGQRPHCLLEKFKFIALLKKKNIDMAVMLNPSKEFNIFAYLSVIPIRIGYARKWDFLLTHKIEDKKYLGQMHEVEYNLELVSIVGARTTDKTLCLSVDNGIIDDLLADSGIKEEDIVVVLHPWTSDSLKQWPQEYFQQLLKRLLELPCIKVVIIGGREESVKSSDYNDTTCNNLVNLAGKTSLLQLAALLKRAKLLISGDSGPVHLACAVGTIALAIFRNDIPGKNPQRWGPWGKGHIVIEKNNLLDINADEVFARVKQVLNR